MEDFADLGRVRLCYESFGDDGAPTVVLIMGLGLDMLWWREDFCVALASRGLRVVRFDNRDVGRSARFPGPVPTPWQFLRRRAPVTYTLEDMADDTGALIAYLAPDGAHVVGVSLGSFVAQQTAIRFPERVRSLVSIMGRPGDGRTGRSSPRMTASMLRAPRHDPVEQMVAAFARIGSAGRTDADEADVRTIMRRSMLRATDDSGSGRQLAAILSESDRTAGLRTLRVPTLVVHGERDRVIRPSGGRATAEAVPGARLMLVPGMGHDLPRRLWPQVIDGIASTALGATGSATR